MRALLQLAAKTAVLLETNSEGQVREREIPAELVQKGDLLKVRGGGCFYRFSSLLYYKRLGLAACCSVLLPLFKTALRASLFPHPAAGSPRRHGGTSIPGVGLF